MTHDHFTGSVGKIAKQRGITLIAWIIWAMAAIVFWSAVAIFLVIAKWW